MGTMRFFASPYATMPHLDKFLEEVEVDSLDELQSEGQPIIQPLSVTNGTAPDNLEAQNVSTNETSRVNDTEHRQLGVHAGSSGDSSNGTGSVDNQLDVYNEGKLLMKQLGADDESDDDKICRQTTVTIGGHVQVHEQQMGDDTNTVMMNAGADEDDESECLDSNATPAPQNPVKEDVNYYNNDAGQTRIDENGDCLLYTSPSPRDQRGSRMPSSA